ncbi:type II toxin-antitoxin system death-on-curing family toxin [Enterococcus cecorum]|uniref:type II toxin-antitoxin system death-on-curing family toxin n=1 Tax=Enterococcus cecorum TaxID=44008 RepID=UPI0022D2E4CB|nr:type II toxin-antitoxin system death-on-curing family toxin [Enterococcus cecorum]CAI3440045.1 type II toxin-antitoxin system death-on-curing family toxin [Enterococcus cecorum]CAI3442325.1 type II toxin-antitoxin system death-on-curing family toxin [Enterococcus cecorum]CAI3451226.1 type II toxin-antitoxin system death-on-curing family toxin [Enterococcus cecorum]CAI3452303.1 type II toxin-antitoxin system death-on-curing family toxin [Enterococcus cecorum]CAI3456547.1 type II toxin-antito
MEYTIKVHDLIIDEIGGLKGIKDYGQLEIVLANIQNDLYYPTFADKLTHLMYSVVQLHMFLYDNKRLALLLGTYFMNINHYSYYTDIFSERMENVVDDVASGKISKEQLKEISIELLELDEIKG